MVSDGPSNKDGGFERFATVQILVRGVLRDSKEVAEEEPEGTERSDGGNGGPASPRFPPHRKRVGTTRSAAVTATVSVVA